VENEARILKLARVSSLKVSDRLDAPKASAKAPLSEGAELAIPLEGLIDFAKERERLGKEIAKLNSEKEKLNAQLSNAGFVERAPQDKVDEIRARVADIEQRLNLLSLNLKALSDS
jgi:valyl-tRNA synthetase